ncbi:MAG: TIGR03617 family F420-dependent LLM class oxidoreductase [Acidimicrobiia bacterium]|nr:TIGR03617 family F420-dependent LLM class oxidoreductase [Acidimicrobiia bacterium]
MKVDFYFPPPAPLSTVASTAARARVLGYDGFFTTETSHDPFLPLVIASQTAPDLDLGTGIALAFPRSPMIVAHTTWDLAALSRGKFILGLGTQVKGHIVRRFAGEWLPPGPRMRDYLLALRAIFRTWQEGVPLDYHGEFYRLSLMTPFFNPGPIEHPDVPLAIAGVGPYMSRLAGELCQAFHVHPFHTVRYLDEVVLPAMARGAESAGRGLDDVDRITSVFVVTGRTEAEIEQAMGAVKQQIAFYASTPNYAPVLELHGWDFGDKLRAMSRRGQWEQMAALISDDVVDEVGVIAPLDRLGEAIRVRYGNRVQRIGYYTLHDTHHWTDEEWRHLVSTTRG